MIILMTLAFTVIAVTGCSNSQLKTPDTAQWVTPSIGYSVAEHVWPSRLLSRPYRAFSKLNNGNKSRI
jgi:hypothetical protein